MPGAISTPSRLEDLAGDVLISSPSSGQVLEWNGSAWVNATVSSGGVSSITSTGGTITPTGSGTVNVEINLAQANTWTAIETHNVTIAANTAGDGVVLINNNAATSGNQRYSPQLRLSGFGFASSGSHSYECDWAMYVQPVQGTSAPSSNLVIGSQINAGGYSTGISIASPGQVTLVSQGAYTVLTIQQASSGQGSTPLFQMLSSGGLPTLQIIYGVGIYLGYSTDVYVYSAAPGTSTVNAIYGSSVTLGSGQMVAWGAGAAGAGNDTAVLRNSAGNIGVTNGVATTYAALGASGLFLAEMSAPGTPSGGGRLYVDSSGNLWYISPGGTSTKLASD